MNPLLRAALEYARRLNWSVFPLAPRAKTPIIEYGVHGSTRDLAQIEAWWQRTPEANVGVATGSISGFWVLDLDEKRNGPDWLREQEHARGQLPRTVQQLTGGGGEHVLFALPEGRQIRNRVSVAPGVDVRGEGGYIVAAPSIHPNGRGYFWDIARHPLEIPLAPAPEWLIKLVHRPADRLPTPSTEWRRLIVDGACEGSRNDSITRLAGHLFRKGIDPDVAHDLLQAWNESRCRPPLERDEVAAAVDSIARAEAQRIGGARS